MGLFYSKKIEEKTETINKDNNEPREKIKREEIKKQEVDNFLKKIREIRVSRYEFSYEELTDEERLTTAKLFIQYSPDCKDRINKDLLKKCLTHLKKVDPHVILLFEPEEYNEILEKYNFDVNGVFYWKYREQPGLDYHGNLLLYFATENNNEIFKKILQRTDININIIFSNVYYSKINKFTILGYLVHNNKTKLLEMLLTERSDIDISIDQYERNLFELNLSSESLILLENYLKNSRKENMIEDWS